MALLAMLFFIGFIFVQGKSLWMDRAWGELAAFLLITLLAAYYILAQLMGVKIVNPVETINNLLNPIILYIFS